MDMQAKTALITGASRGIGRAIAIELAKQGVAQLLLVARDGQKLAEVASDIESLGAIAVPLSLDLTQSTQVSISAAQAWRDYGPIHILVNCAGVAHQSLFHETRPQDMEAELMVNLMGLYTVTRIISRRMISQKKGLIVNVSSLMGRLPAPTLATYSATKFAIVGFSQALRAELSPHNVEVVTLLPSLTDTEMVEKMKWFQWVLPLSPEQVARALIKGLKAGSKEILVGWQSHLALWGQRIAPRWIESLIGRAAPTAQPKMNSSGRRKTHLSW